MPVMGKGSGLFAGAMRFLATRIPSVVAEKNGKPGGGPMHVWHVVARERHATGPVELATRALELRKQQPDHHFQMTVIARPRRLAERPAAAHDQAVMMVAAIIEQQLARIRCNVSLGQ